MTKFLAAAVLLAVTACAPEPTAQELAVTKQAQQIVAEREQEQRRVQVIQQSNPQVNWLYTGISTSKYGEELVTEVYQTYSECQANQTMEANTCTATAALPESYWNAQ